MTINSWSKNDAVAIHAVAIHAVATLEYQGDVVSIADGCVDTGRDPSGATQVKIASDEAGFKRLVRKMKEYDEVQLDGHKMYVRNFDEARAIPDNESAVLWLVSAAPILL